MPCCIIKLFVLVQFLMRKLNVNGGSPSLHDALLVFLQKLRMDTSREPIFEVSEPIHAFLSSDFCRVRPADNKTWIE